MTTKNYENPFALGMGITVLSMLSGIFSGLFLNDVSTMFVPFALFMIIGMILADRNRSKSPRAYIIKVISVPVIIPFIFAVIQDVAYGSGFILSKVLIYIILGALSAILYYFVFWLSQHITIKLFKKKNKKPAPAK